MRCVTFYDRRISLESETKTRWQVNYFKLVMLIILLCIVMYAQEGFEAVSAAEIQFYQYRKRRQETTVS